MAANMTNQTVSKPRVKLNDPLTNEQRKSLKGIAHQLSPIVTIGVQGVSDRVLEEIGRALDDHELIKIKIPAGSKEQRDAVAQAVVEATQATLISSIGRVCVLLRQNPEANPKLSNLVRLD